MEQITLSSFERLVKNYTQEQFLKIQAFAKTRFQLKDDISLTMSTASKRKRSWGGYSVKKKKMFISLVLKQYVQQAYYDFKTNCAGNTTFHEYSGFKQSPDIGQVTGYWTTAISALICHEISHAVQFNRSHGSGATIDDGYKSAKIVAHNGKQHAKHGLDFQYIYKVIRDEFVNPLCENGVQKNELVSAPPSVDTVEPLPEKKPRNRKFISSVDKENGFKVYNYFTPEKELIGRLFILASFIKVKPSFDLTMDSWNTFGTVCEARNSLLEAYRNY